MQIIGNRTTYTLLRKSKFLPEKLIENYYIPVSLFFDVLSMEIMFVLIPVFAVPVAAPCMLCDPLARFPIRADDLVTIPLVVGFL